MTTEPPIPIKPFELEAALNGARLVTRSGKAVRDFQLNPYPLFEKWGYQATIVGQTLDPFSVEEYSFTFTEEGKYSSNGISHEYDLFLVDEEFKTGEVLGQPHPSWPEDLKTFEERSAFQRGVAAARQVDDVANLRTRVERLEAELSRLVSALNKPFQSLEQHPEKLTEEWEDVRQAMMKNNPHKIGG